MMGSEPACTGPSTAQRHTAADVFVSPTMRCSWDFGTGAGFYVDGAALKAVAHTIPWLQQGSGMTSSVTNSFGCRLGPN